MNEEEQEQPKQPKQPKMNPANEIKLALRKWAQAEIMKERQADIDQLLNQAGLKK